MAQLDRVYGVKSHRPIVAAFLAILAGIGLSRFAYSPLIPALIDAGWFTPLQAVYLGAANLAGYLLGALSGQRLATVTPRRWILRASMLVATASFLGCAIPAPFPWFFMWRLASGVAGGILIVLAATTVLSHVRTERRGLAAGMIFSGVGVGIILSGTLVPALVSWGVSEAWCMLAGLSLLATCVAWRWWPVHHAEGAGPASTAGAQMPARRALIIIFLTYGAIAVGLAGQ